MQDVVFSIEDVKQCIRKTSNWKSTGPDKLHNFWLKQFTALHAALAQYFNDALLEPALLPKFLSVGTTHLLYKKGDKSDPKHYRPITCLWVLYKLFTSLLHLKIYNHCDFHNILSTEQKGCIKNSLGCKEQLTIDAVIIKQAEKTQKSKHGLCGLPQSLWFHPTWLAY